MIENKKYSSEELCKILDTKTNQNTIEKLKRYKVKFTDSGRGKTRTFTIENIENEFKVFCITELKMSAKVDYNKFKYLVYNLFNDPDVAWLPNTMLEDLIENSDVGIRISRQTISKYKNVLAKSELIYISISDFTYYFAANGGYNITDKETYCKAWREYFDRDESSPKEAIKEMIKKYGGVARKQPKIILNGIYKETYTRLNDLAIEEILKDYKQSNSDD